MKRAFSPAADSDLDASIMMTEELRALEQARVRVQTEESLVKQAIPPTRASIAQAAADLSLKNTELVPIMHKFLELVDRQEKLIEERCNGSIAIRQLKGALIDLKSGAPAQIEIEREKMCALWERVKAQALSQLDEKGYSLGQRLYSNHYVVNDEEDVMGDGTWVCCDCALTPDEQSSNEMTPVFVLSKSQVVKGVEKNVHGFNQPMLWVYGDWRGAHDSIQRVNLNMLAFISILRF